MIRFPHLLGFCLLACSALAGCRSHHGASNEHGSSPVTAHSEPTHQDIQGRALLLAASTWIDSAERDPAHLERLRSFGEDAATLLAATLRKGLSRTQSESLRRELERDHERLLAYGKATGEAITVDRTAYVAEGLRAATARARGRAALALGQIDSRTSRIALTEVAAQLERELGELIPPPPETEPLLRLVRDSLRQLPR